MIHLPSVGTVAEALRRMEDVGEAAAMVFEPLGAPC